jgi:RNA polymerase sigma-70 factor (ECF subfamily)
MILRRKRSRVEISLDSSTQTSDTQHWDLPDRSVDIESQHLQAERAEHLRQAVTRLRPNLRRVLEIQQHQDGSIFEIAATAGLSVAATKSRLLRARTALRRSLDRPHPKPARAVMSRH